MNPKETEIIDLLMKAAEKALEHMEPKPSCEICRDIRDMVEMARRLMADD